MIGPRSKTVLAWAGLAAVLLAGIHVISTVTGNLMRSSGAANDARRQVTVLAERKVMAQRQLNAVAGSSTDLTALKDALTPLSTDLEISDPMPFREADAAPSSAHAVSLSAAVPANQLDAFLEALAQPGLYVQHLTVDRPDPTGPFRVQGRLVSFAYGVEDGDGT